MKKVVVIGTCISLLGCASSPQVIIDPGSIRDTTAYAKDMDECRAISRSYDMSGATTGSAAIGAGAAVGTAALVLATGGLYLLPAGVLMAGAGGAAVGGGLSQSKETSAREKIWAACMTDRGYKAYTS